MKKEKYFEIHDDALKIFNENMSTFISKYSNCPVACVMFGTNIIAELIVEKLKNTSLDIAFIVDNSKKRQGKIVYGKEVYSPEYLKNNYNEKYIILIASSFQNDMIEQVKSYGYKEDDNIVKIIDLPQLMNDYSYADRIGYELLNREQIKEVQIGILKELEKIHQREGIKYYLNSGSALGAVRHKGYIPWDDDVDVFLPINDYLRLIKILEKNSRYKVISQFNTDYYFGWGFGYMVDTDTVCDINKFPIQLTTGQSVDLFPLYGMPENEIEIKSYIEKTKKLELNCFIAENDAQRIKAINELNRYLLSYNYNECSVVGNVLMPAFLDDIFDRDIFGDGVYMEFEKNMFIIPEKYDVYLKQMYGDYMKLPPVEKRVGDHFYRVYKNASK